MLDSSVYGLLLMLGYLGFDGFTSTFQDKLFKGFQMTTYNQILYTTLWSSLLSCFGRRGMAERYLPCRIVCL
jgi:adenosine 3'-phospho 5'-phosphosulfate transporter B2